MILPVLGLILAGVAIYFSCEAFVNGIEWTGRKLGVSETATGTLLAAIGTALPESIVSFVALALGDNATDDDIGIGAVLGGPLALSTVAYAAVGAAILLKGRQAAHMQGIDADTGWLIRAQVWFLIVFAIKIALGVVAFPYKEWTGLGFLAVYVAFFTNELFNQTREDIEPYEPLKLRPRDKNPATAWVLAQTLIAIVVMFAASHFFVAELAAVSRGFGLAPGPTALFLSPLATELPEAVNAIIWVRQGRARLALANISGAMMIQATIPTAFGLLFSPWLLDQTELLSAAFTAAAIAMMLIVFATRRASGAALVQVGWLYALFVAAVALID